MIYSVKKDRNPHIKSAAFVLGLTSIIGQILLMRELVTVFYGNEIAYAVILAGWLFWIALGSYAVSLFAARVRDPITIISILQSALYFLLPATIIAVRHAKLFLRFQTGEIVGMTQMGLASFLLLAPLTFLLGGLFTLICISDRNNREKKEDLYGISSAYLWESAGATVGGMVFSFLLIMVFPAMHLAFLMGAVNLVVGVVLYKRADRFFAVKIVLILMTGVMIFNGTVSRLDRWTRQRQWTGLEVVASTDSIYGNITMTRLDDEYSLYENGLFSYATRDELLSEETVHFPLLEHPRPRKILLIGNGIGGSLREILKHPQAEVDYVELDPKIIEVSRKYLPAGHLQALEDSRVEIFYTDARRFVKQASSRYDVIIVNLGDPQTALINRYYSLEFFREASSILKPDGILSLSVSSSANYLNDEARAFLRSIHTTLSRVFPDVRSIPGDTNIFLACVNTDVLTYDDRVLTARLKERNIDATYMREYYLPSKMSAGRIRYIEEVLSEEGTLNTDARPIAYLYNIILWSTHFDTGFKGLAAKIQNIRFPYFFLLPVFIFIGGWGWKRISSTAPVTLSIMTTGFSEIIFQLVVILAFQTIYGYAYYKIGWIMASFMGGLCLGAIIARRIIARAPASIPRVYKAAQFGIFLYPLLLPLVFIIFRDVQTTQRLAGVLASVFATLPVIAGFIGGLQYPLAVYWLHRAGRKKEGGAAGSAGFLYAMDVVGATLGAFVTGTFLIPLFGIHAVAFLCAAVNGAVFLLLYPAKLSPDR